MIMRKIENHTLFCKNKLYKKMDDHVVPKTKNKVEQSDA